MPGDIDDLVSTKLGCQRLPRRESRRVSPLVACIHFLSLTASPGEFN